VETTPTEKVKKLKRKATPVEQDLMPGRISERIKASCFHAYMNDGEIFVGNAAGPPGKEACSQMEVKLKLKLKKEIAEARAIDNANAQKAGKPLPWPLLAPVATPSAAQPAKDSPAAAPPAAAAAPVAAKDSPPAKPPKAPMVPLQIRIAAGDAKAIKHAAVDAGQTISDFMLACFHTPRFNMSIGDAKAIQHAALEANQNVTDFMLACFHSYMKK
jgi:uncharacterized protein (DUF1778 family)